MQNLNRAELEIHGEHDAVATDPSTIFLVAKVADVASVGVSCYLVNRRSDAPGVTNGGASDFSLYGLWNVNAPHSCRDLLMCSSRRARTRLGHERLLDGQHQLQVHHPEGFLDVACAKQSGEESK